MPTKYRRSIVRVQSLFVLLSFLFVNVFPGAVEAVTFECVAVDENETTSYTSTSSSSGSSGAMTLSSAVTPVIAPIKLTELYPAPLSGQVEFTELYNPNTSNVDISGYSLTDASGKKYTFPSDESSVITAGSYLIVPFAQSKIYLNNDADTLTLENASGVVIDSTSYSGALSGMSWSRLNTGLSSSTSSEWAWSTVPTGGATNIFLTSPRTDDTQDPDATPAHPTPTTPTTPVPVTPAPVTTQTNGLMRINELLPDPVGTDTDNEWIELINPASSATNLENWVLTDGTTRYTLHNQSINGSGGLLVVSNSVSHITLNNTTDTIQLIDPNGTVVDTATYTKPVSGSTWAKIAGNFVWTKTPTPGAVNILSSSATGGDAGATTSSKSGSSTAVTSKTSTTKTASTSNGAKTTSTAETQTSSGGVVSIRAARALEPGAEAVIEGVVTTLPNQLGSQIIMVQDAASGIQIYSYAKQFPVVLQLGSRVRVNGEISDYHGTARLKITQASDITVISVSGAAPQPISIADASMISESNEGMFVHTSSPVSEKSGASWVLENGVTLSIKATTGIKAGDFKNGTALNVLGVVEEYNGEHRIAPRSAADLNVAEDAAGENGDDSTSGAGGITNADGTSSGDANSAATKNSTNKKGGAATSADADGGGVGNHFFATGGLSAVSPWATIGLAVILVGLFIVWSLRDAVIEKISESQHPAAQWLRKKLPQFFPDTKADTNIQMRTKITRGTLDEVKEQTPRIPASGAPAQHIFTHPGQPMPEHTPYPFLNMSKTQEIQPKTSYFQDPILK